MNCKNLTEVILPKNLEEIEARAFASCARLPLLIMPNSPVAIDDSAFSHCENITIVCRESSQTHQYCLDNRLTYLFDYQFEAFHGVIPPGIEKLASPFLADEEKPFIFISYSHKDRDEVLQIIKTLYESGWKIWYDEGLTIGDRYDETLEEHVRNCSAFLLFVTENSLNSYYCRENEIPWAIEHGKPIIRCNLVEGLNYEVEESAVAATVSQADIETALEKISGLSRGERRIAKGISVVVNPADRGGASGDGFACCLYTGENAAAAKAIMLEAKNSGCTLYDAVEEGADEEKLQHCACLIVFLDKRFLADGFLSKKLIEAYQSGRDIAICQLESISNDDLPQELVGLHKMQWLHYVHGITSDMNTKLARHLQKRGCRNAAVLPGFEYEKTGEGIVINRYTGKEPSLRIESEYGNIPVVEIADEAFRNCIHLKSVLIPDTVTAIGNHAFEGCINLSSAVLGAAVTSIGTSAFEGCSALTSIVIPQGLTEVKDSMFKGCASLASFIIPDGVTEIGDHAFGGCTGLTSLTIPDRVTKIGDNAFEGCTGLTSLTIPDGVSVIGEGAFSGCSSLTSFVIPHSVKEIGKGAFNYCPGLTAITIPDSMTEIGDDMFQECTGLRSVTIPDSVTNIGKSAFLFCTNLSAIIIPKSVTEIGYGAFCLCSALTDVTIPESVTYIGTSAFEGCTNLSSVIITNSETYFASDVFKDCENLTVTCPRGSKAWEYCKDESIPVKPLPSGFFARLFGRK